MSSIDLIRQFVDERLQGDISKLATYELRFLDGDKKYGNPNRGYDADDTELMRAIYCIVFDEAWPDVENNLKSYKLRGDTINTFATMFGKVRGDYRPEVHPGLDKHSPSSDVVKIVEDFHQLCDTIGNMTILPNIYHDQNTINAYRGCHDVWHDYEDRFLMALYLILTDGKVKDQGLLNLVRANDCFFQPYYGTEGWKSFIDCHFLNDYVDDNYIPIISSKGFFYWNTWNLSEEQYLEEAKRYCIFATYVIQNRAEKMIESLKKRL